MTPKLISIAQNIQQVPTYGFQASQTQCVPKKQRRYRVNNLMERSKTELRSPRVKLIELSLTTPSFQRTLMMSDNQEQWNHKKKERRN